MNMLWANKNCPKNGQVWLYHPENRCRGFLIYRGYRYSTSAALSEGGDEKATLLCLQWVWKSYCKLSGNSCPIKDLLEKEF